MVKYSKVSNKIFTIKLKMPLKTLLLWHKKCKEYIKLLKSNKNKNIEYPTIYISKKYQKMDCLELCKIIKGGLKKYITYIFQNINAVNKESLIHLNKQTIKEYPNKALDIKEKEQKQEIILKNINISNLSEDIKIVNELNCSHMKHLFESHIFSENSEKYDNCFVKQISINKKKIKKFYTIKANNKSSLKSKKKNNIKSIKAQLFIVSKS